MCATVAVYIEVLPVFTTSKHEAGGTHSRGLSGGGLQKRRQSQIKIKVNAECSLHRRGTHDMLELHPALLLALEAVPGHVRMRLAELEYRSHAGPAIECVHLVCVYSVCVCCYTATKCSSMGEIRVCVYTQRYITVRAQVYIYI